MSVPGAPVPATVTTSPGAACDGLTVTPAGVYSSQLLATVVVVLEVVVVLVVVVGGGMQPHHCCEVLMSNGNRSGPCQAPSGEMVAGVAPVTTSNCTGSQVLVKTISVTPGCWRLKPCDSTKFCGHATPLPGMA